MNTVCQSVSSSNEVHGVNLQSAVLWWWYCFGIEYFQTLFQVWFSWAAVDVIESSTKGWWTSCENHSRHRLDWK